MRTHLLQKLVNTVAQKFLQFFRQTTARIGIAMVIVLGHLKMKRKSKTEKLPSWKSTLKEDGDLVPPNEVEARMRGSFGKDNDIEWYERYLRDD